MKACLIVDGDACPAFAAEVDFGGDVLHGVRRAHPAEQPLRFGRAHVDAAVTHRRAEIFVPIRSMEGVTGGREKTRPRDAGQNVIVGIGEEVDGAALPQPKIAVTHVFGGDLFLNVKLADRGIEVLDRDARGDLRLKDRLVVLVSDQRLCAEVDIDTLLVLRDIG